jgi:hypothetical protein
VLYGTAIGSGSAANRYLLTGTATFNFEWDSNLFTSTLIPTAANQRTGASTALGTYTANGSFAGAQGMSNTFFAGIAGVAGATGRLDGRFFGSAAQELGAVFTLTTPGAGTTLIGSGAVVAKR